MTRKLLCGLFTLVILLVSQHAPCIAQVRVDLSDDGQLSIVGSKSFDHVYLRMAEGELVVWDNGPVRTSYPYDLEAVHGITIQLGGDIDVVEFDVLRGTLTGNIEIDTGKDRDIVRINGRQFATDDIILGDVMINTGHGNDYVEVTGLTIVGNTQISTGHGRDEVSLDSRASFFVGNEILGNLTINTGNDPDIVTFDSESGTYVGGDFVLSLGQGDDSAYRNVEVDGNTWVSGGQGTDSALFFNVTAAEVVWSGFED